MAQSVHFALMASDNEKCTVPQAAPRRTKEGAIPAREVADFNAKLTA